MTSITSFTFLLFQFCFSFLIFLLHDLICSLSFLTLVWSLLTSRCPFLKSILSCDIYSTILNILFNFLSLLNLFDWSIIHLLPFLNYRMVSSYFECQLLPNLNLHYHHWYMEPWSVANSTLSYSVHLDISYVLHWSLPTISKCVLILDVRLHIRIGTCSRNQSYLIVHLLTLATCWFDFGKNNASNFHNMFTNWRCVIYTYLSKYTSVVK